MKRCCLISLYFMFVSAFVFNLPLRASSEHSEEIRQLIGKFTLLPTERDKAITRIVSYGDEAVPILIASLSTTSVICGIAENSVRSLERIGTPLAIESMGKLVLEHSYHEWTTRDIAVKCAIESLERLGPAGEKELVRALANKDSQVQYWVTDALARIGTPTAVAGLISDLPDNHAANALGKIKSCHAVEGLVASLPSPQAIIALGEIKDPRAIVPLLRLMHEGKNYSAEEALAEFEFPMVPLLYKVAAGIPNNINLVEQQTMFTDQAVHLLVSQKVNERLLAEFAIERIGKLMVPSLAKALESSDDEHLRISAADLLGKMRDQNALKALITALQDKNSLVAAHAALSLGELGNQSAVVPLTHLAKTGSPYERRGAVWSIAKIGTTSGNAVLKGLCKDKDEYVRKIAASGPAGC